MNKKLVKSKIKEFKQKFERYLGEEKYVLVSHIATKKAGKIGQDYKSWTKIKYTYYTVYQIHHYPDYVDLEIVGNGKYREQLVERFKDAFTKQ